MICHWVYHSNMIQGQDNTNYQVELKDHMGSIMGKLMGYYGPTSCVIVSFIVIIWLYIDEKYLNNIQTCRILVLSVYVSHKYTSNP